MPATTTWTPTTPAPLSRSERLELANQLYREYHTRCFWHSPRDLVITEDLIPFVVKGLRTHGGRWGFILSGKLQPKGRPIGPRRENVGNAAKRWSISARLD